MTAVASAAPSLTDAAPAPSIRPAPQWFGFGLLALVVLGVAVRIASSFIWTDGGSLSGDPLFFQQAAANLAHGHGFAVPLFGHGAPVPTALHPPFFSFVLAGFDILGIQSAASHRIVLSLVSAGGILAMGFLGRRLLGPAAGLLAAGIAALSPLWVQTTGKLLSESIYLVIIPLLLLAALRCVDRATGWRFAIVGLLVGVAALTRSDGLSFVILLGVPLALFSSPRWATRFRFGLIFLAGCALVLVPWFIRNDIQMGGFTISTDSGTTLSGAYTSNTFNPHSPLYGSFDQNAQFGDSAVLLEEGRPPDHAKHWTELALSNAIGRIGTTYARGHLSDLPGVVLAREGRLWGLYASGSELQFDLASDGDGNRAFQLGGQYLNWVLLPLAVVGGIGLFRRSRRNLVVVLAPIVAATLSAAVTFGSTRYRIVTEPSIALLASIGVVLLVERLNQVRHRRRVDPVESSGTFEHRSA